MRKQLLALTALSAWACTDPTRVSAPLGAPTSTVAASDDAEVAASFQAKRGVIRIEAYIDGRSELAVNANVINQMEWRHYDFAAPGRLGGVVLPTRIRDLDWYPDWPDVPDSENRDCHCSSSPANWPVDFWLHSNHDLDFQVIKGRGSATLTGGANAFSITFDDNVYAGADWYVVSVDSRYPLVATPWPNRLPYVVSLSQDRFVTVALLSEGAPGLDTPDQLTDFSLGDDNGSEAGVATAQNGSPLKHVIDVNNDTIDDIVLRFRVKDLVYRGDASLGNTVLRVTARSPSSPNHGLVRGDLPVTFVP